MAFGFYTLGSIVTDGIIPADGVTLTHSTPAQHIWTFAAATNSFIGCPCNPSATASLNVDTVEFADSNYYCDVTADSVAEKTLWAGDCGILETELPECCNVNGPPFFVSTLTSPTSENVDARLCIENAVGPHDAALFIQRMELYVQ